MRPLLLIHAVLILLACTRFTVLTYWFDDEGYWTLNYYSYGWAKGFGTPYESDFTAAQIITYLIAFVVGFVAFGWVCKRGGRVQRVAAVIGCIASLVGIYSFWTEWGAVAHPTDPYSTWRAFSSALMLILTIVAALPGKEQTDADSTVVVSSTEHT